MTGKPDDQTTPATSREPLIGGDPLKIGGMTDPDAPSRRPQPKVVALLGEFFRMSRTTAVLLGAFFLAGALYLLVREEPVVAFGPTPAPVPVEPSAPVSPTPSVSESPSATSEPTPTEPTSPSDIDTTTVDTTDPTATKRREATTPAGPGGRTTAQTQQEQPQPQQQPQLQVPDAGAAGSPEAGQVVEPQ